MIRRLTTCAARVDPKRRSLLLEAYSKANYLTPYG